MEIFYKTVLHITNLFFLFVVGVVAVGAMANPSAGDVHPLNGVTSGIILFLLLLCLANYIFQIKKGGWMTLLIGHAVYIAVFYLSLVKVLPFLFAKFYG